MHAMATHARRRAIVVFLKQCSAMRTLLEFRQLISGQRRIELMHHGRVGMAARAEFNDPCPVLLSIFLWPFLDESMSHLGSGIAAMTTGARNAAPKMNVLDDLFQVHVR
jgi:hypothetical protein